MSDKIRAANFEYLKGDYSFLKVLAIPVRDRKEAANIKEQILKEHKTSKMLMAELSGIIKLQKSINKQALKDQEKLKAVTRKLNDYYSKMSMGADEITLIDTIDSIIEDDK